MLFIDDLHTCRRQPPWRHRFDIYPMRFPSLPSSAEGKGKKMSFKPAAMCLKQRRWIVVWKRKEGKGSVRPY